MINWISTRTIFEEYVLLGSSSNAIMPQWHMSSLSTLFEFVMSKMLFEREVMILCPWQTSHYVHFVPCRLSKLCDNSTVVYWLLLVLQCVQTSEINELHSCVCHMRYPMICTSDSNFSNNQLAAIFAMHGITMWQKWPLWPHKGHTGVFLTTSISSTVGDINL